MTIESNFVLPPGETLAEELEAREMTRRELAAKMGRPVRVVSDLLAARRTVTPDLAIDLEAALGPSAQFWLSLETAFQLAEARKRRAAKLA